ncbi:MAG: hypothetical protein K2O63_05495 [Alistipes sp.]|nr:hypothetical protein [Alistipes sp.]
MKHLNLFSLFMAFATLSLLAPSCSDTKEEPLPDMLPSVTLAAGTATGTTLSVTVTPANADRCVVKAFGKEQALPAAESLLIDDEATAADPAKGGTVVLENLAPDTEYIILAAVLGYDQTALSSPLSMRTLTAADTPTPTPTPIEITFSESWKERTAEGSWVVSFYDGSYIDNTATHELIIDFRNSPATNYLPAGTYKSGKSGSEIFHSDYSYLRFRKENGAPWKNITDGEIVVEIPEGNTYRIAMDVTLSDGRKLKAEYEGEISGMTVVENREDYEFALTAASRTEKNGQIAGEYLITLNDSPVWKHEMSLDFYADPASESLPEGTYTLGETTSAGTLGQSGSSLGVYNSGDMTGGYKFSSGTVVVTKEGDTYTFAIELTSDDCPRKFVGTFSGGIGNMDLAN